jgi:serine/threonine-protein kinase
VADEADIEGQRLGRYTLVRRLGKGGMGEVFLARASGARGFEKLVAIKRILPQFSANKQVVNMLVDEARISVRLNHPNVVQVHELDVDDADGAHFIVMEYVDGHALSRLIRRVKKRGERLDPLVACAIVIGVLDGLQAAHTEHDDDGKPARIIHRDISPQNILLSMGGQVKVIDFGIARARDRLEATQGSQVKGKLRYMAPEQIKPTLAGSSGIDHRIDLFAAGTMLWEMLAMRARYPQATDLEVIDAILEEETPDLASEGVVDDELMSIIATATQKDRRKRFKDAAGFAAALRGYLYARDPAFSPQRIAQLMRHHFSDAGDDDAPAPAPVAVKARVVEKNRGRLADDADEHEVTRTQFRPPPQAEAPVPAPRARPRAPAPRVPPSLIGALLGGVMLVAVLLIVRAVMKPQPLPIAEPTKAGATALAGALPPPGATSSPLPAASQPPTPNPPTAANSGRPSGAVDLGGDVELVVEVTPLSASIALAYRPEPRYVSPARLRLKQGDVVDLVFEATGYEPLRKQVLVDAAAPRVQVALTPIPMPLLIRVVPRDADVTVNGVPWRVGATVKPDQDLVIAATHPFFVGKRVTVRSVPGEALTVDLTLDERSTAELTTEQPADADPPPPPTMGRVVVTSRPTGADVFVDGKRAASKTPLRQDLKPGVHKITVRAPGAEQTFTIDVAAGARVAREVVLE